jgi:hypothetical protein
LNVEEQANQELLELVKSHYPSAASENQEQGTLTKSTLQIAVMVEISCFRFYFIFLHKNTL